MSYFFGLAFFDFFGGGFIFKRSETASLNLRGFKLIFLRLGMNSSCHSLRWLVNYIIDIQFFSRKIDYHDN